MGKVVFTGFCVCGHSWDDHHHSCILNLEALKGREYRNVNGMLGEECEATQFEGMFTPHIKIIHEDGRIEDRYYKERCFCSVYHDKGWPGVRENGDA